MIITDTLLQIANDDKHNQHLDTEIEHFDDNQNNLAVLHVNSGAGCWSTMSVNAVGARKAV